MELFDSDKVEAKEFLDVKSIQQSHLKMDKNGKLSRVIQPLSPPDLNADPSVKSMFEQIMKGNKLMISMMTTVVAEIIEMKEMVYVDTPAVTTIASHDNALNDLVAVVVKDKQPAAKEADADMQHTITQQNEDLDT